MPENSFPVLLIDFITPDTMLIYGFPTGRQGRKKQRRRKRQRRISDIKNIIATFALIITTALMYGGIFTLLFLIARWIR